MNVKRILVLRFFLVMVAGLVGIVCGVSAQTKVYGQTNFVSNAPAGFNSVDPQLQNPWGMAFAPRQAFFISSSARGQVRMYDAVGDGVFPFAFRVFASAADPTRSRPSGIVFNPVAADFLLDDISSQFVVVSQDGTISGWGVDAVGDIPTFATLAKDDSATGAVYTGVAILNPPGASEFLAVADFHNGRIQTLDTKFGDFAIAGNFVDRNLPAGFAPFNIQQIGNQVFVTYALQDADKQNPVIGSENGIVDIFDQQGNFVRRFASGGTLNAPWGVTVASADFGPFSNEVLIGNFGDGTISAFDPASGNFVGQLKDGTGNPIANPGIRAITFRPDGFGDVNTLYFAAGSVDGQAGLFGAITSGLASTTSVAVAPSPVQSGSRAGITITVAAGPGNAGVPTGNIIFQVGDEAITAATLTNGVFQFNDVLTGVGTYVIKTEYSGDTTFLPSSSLTAVQVVGQATTLTLDSHATAFVGEAVKLTATIHSASGTPTGMIVFHDGTIALGAVALDATGMAALTVSNLAAGIHSITADYTGDENFDVSTAAAVTVTITNPDFSFGAAPPSATVAAGQSTNFMLTVTPAGGFANNVTFSCAPVTGITCTFAPPTVTPTNGVANTTLTVTASAGVLQYGVMAHRPIGPIYFFATLSLLSLLVRHRRKFPRLRTFLLTATTVMAIVGLSTGLGGCGGYSSGTAANRGTASINVTAQSGNISHATIVSVTVQ
jgi:uncharacterized protein (TIGR03118 family)